MKTFTFTYQKQKYTIICEWKKTSSAFKHVATLLNNYNNEIDKTKICYLNRTWERYDFESVLSKILEKHFPKMTTKRVNFYLEKFNPYKGF